MAKKYNGFVAGLSQFLDQIAGLSLVAVMLVVVGNVLMRALFKHPILGTYDYVGFLTATAIGLALAHCALQNAHIAVDFVVERLPRKTRALIDTATNSVAITFWGFALWNLAIYAGTMKANGIVAATSQLPVSPFIYLVAFGLFSLCLVLLSHLGESLRRVAR
jgi:TRAP-type C4-dicarboxylate transport system permease small subunit